MKAKTKAKVAIIMGSKTDLKVMQEARDALKEFGVESDVMIVSAHRTPQFMQEFALKAEKKGYAVIIAGAGGAAHLPGMVASLTPLPVIGVPVQIGKLKGLDALLSIVQMPKGVPVATVAVDNAYNAGLLAVRILSCQEKLLLSKMRQFQSKQKKKVMKASRELKLHFG